MTFDPNTDATCLKKFPSNDVPDHQVLVSFRFDLDALEFEDWLLKKGFGLFAEFMSEKSV